MLPCTAEDFFPSAVFPARLQYDRSFDATICVPTQAFCRYRNRRRQHAGIEKKISHGMVRTCLRTSLLRELADALDSLTCRQRKLKCDEVKPECSQCRKTGRRCQPNEGLIFRHQQNASMNGTIDNDVNTVGPRRFYTYKDTFDQDQTWVDIPQHGAILHSQARFYVAYI